MRRSRGLRLAGAFALAAAGAALGAPAAQADEQIVAGPPSQYLTTQVTIDQGEKVTFSNNDLLEHDVVSRDNGPDGQPLFRSELIGTGASAPVAGTEFLTTRDYEFFCSIHSNMVGTLTVTSAGQPATRPGGSGGGAPDTTKPSVSLKVLDSNLQRVRHRGRLRVALTVDEPATVRVRAKAKKTTFARGRAAFTAAGTKKVKLKVTAAGQRLAGRSDKLRVAVVARATDAAGNAGTGRTSAKLR